MRVVIKQRNRAEIRLKAVSYSAATMASQGQAEGGADNLHYLTPLRAKQQTDARLASVPEAETGLDAEKLLTPETGKASVLRNAEEGDFQDTGFVATQPYIIKEKLSERRSLMEFIPSTRRSGVRDGSGTFPLHTYIQSAINSGEKLYAPPGVYAIEGGIEASGANLQGDGMAKSYFKKTNGPDEYDMMRVTGGSGHDLQGFTLDGNTSTDTLNGSGLYLLSGATDGTVANVGVKNQNTQGFATNAATWNKFFGLRAKNCGHRGMNISANSDDNIIHDFHAASCKKAGFLMGFVSNRNIVSKLRLYDSIEGCFWLHHGCERNVITDVIAGAINAAASTQRPVVRVEIACRHNQLSNFQIVGARNWGLYVNNGPVVDPAGGVVNGPCERNKFRGFSISGDLPTNGTSTGLLLQNSVENFGTLDNEFEDFFISGFERGVSYNSSLVLRSEFRNFKFGTINTSRWHGINFGASLGTQFRNCNNLNNAGSLALSGTDFGVAQPTYAAATAIANPFGVPVMVNVYSATAIGVQINGTSVNNPTLPNNGNGEYLLLPGQTITLNGGSSVTWRWRTAGG